MYKLRITPIIVGILIGIIIGVIFELIYVVIFNEAGSRFYLFTGLALFGGPAMGAGISALAEKNHKLLALLLSGSFAFVTMFILLALFYIVLPLFTYDNVQLPATSNTGSHMPSSLNYPIPGVGTGTLIAEDNYSVVVVMSDYDHLPYASTVYLINKSGNKVLRSLSFSDDVISAAIDKGTLNLFHDKLGYYINTENGEFVKTIIRLDNYWQFRTSDSNDFIQTTFETTVLYADGSVDPHQRMYMNSTALGYFIWGSEGRIIE